MVVVVLAALETLVVVVVLVALVTLVVVVVLVVVVLMLVVLEVVATGIGAPAERTLPRWEHRFRPNSEQVPRPDSGQKKA